MSNLPSINFLPGQHFECTACGKCCKGAWNIAVDNDSFHSIKASQSFQKQSKKGYLPLVLAEDKQASLGRDSRGACVFLADDNLCEVHGELGMESKPLVCRTYPHMLTKTPEGYFSSLSFACPAVLSNSGKPIAESGPELQKMLASSNFAVPQNLPIDTQVPLTEEVTLSWSDYLRLEQHLLSAFKPQQPALSLLSMASELASAVGEGTLNSLLAEGFTSHGVSSAYAHQLLEIFSVNCLSILELESSPEKRADFMDELMTQRSTPSPRHGISLQPFSITAKPQPADLKLIHYYFQNIVFGKRLAGESLLSALLSLAVGMALLLYYLEAFRGAGLESQKAAVMAFELIEAEVVTHSRGMKPLLSELPKALLAQADSIQPAA